MAFRSGRGDRDGQRLPGDTVVAVPLGFGRCTCFPAVQRRPGDPAAAGGESGPDPGAGTGGALRPPSLTVPGQAAAGIPVGVTAGPPTLAVAVLPPGIGQRERT